MAGKLHLLKTERVHRQTVSVFKQINGRLCFPLVATLKSAHQLHAERCRFHTAMGLRAWAHIKTVDGKAFHTKRQSLDCGLVRMTAADQHRPGSRMAEIGRREDKKS